MARKSILIADDLAERSTAGRLRSKLLRNCVADLAKKLNLEIDLLYVKDLNPALLKKNQVKALEDSFDAIASAAMAQFKKAAVQGQMHLRAGPPAEEILTFAEISSDVQMMALGTHGRKGLKKLVLGSVAEEVLRNAKVPVMVLGPAAQEKQSTLKFEKNFKVLLLTDLTESSAAATAFTADLCKDLNCPLSVLHSIGDQIMKTRTTLYGSGYVPFDIDKMFKEMADDARKKLDREIKTLQRQGLSVTPLVSTKEEPIEKTFLSQVRQGYGLVVIGTHGRNRALSAFLGSTARKVIFNSPVPVFVVRGRTQA